MTSGAALGVGGHLTALRRTAGRPLHIEQARTLEQLAALADPVTLPMADAVRAAMPVREVDADEVSELSYGRRAGAQPARRHLRRDRPGRAGRRPAARGRGRPRPGPSLVFVAR